METSGRPGWLLCCVFFALFVSSYFHYLSVLEPAFLFLVTFSASFLFYFIFIFYCLIDIAPVSDNSVFTNFAKIINF